MKNFTANPLAYFQGIKVATIEDCLKSDGKALATIRKEVGEMQVIAAVQILILNLCEFFSVGKNMNNNQIKETARLLVKDYYYLKIDDLRLFFDKMKGGAYGQLYDRLDGSVILNNLREYCEERISVAEELNHKKHVELKSGEEKIYIIKVGKNYVREAGDLFEETDSKELATCFAYGTAYKLKEWLVKDYYPTNPKEVKILDINVKGEGLFDYLEHHKPELLPKEERYRRATTEYFEMKRKILADESLDTLGKENAIRALNRLEPLTVEEYNMQQIVYAGEHLNKR